MTQSLNDIMEFDHIIRRLKLKGSNAMELTNVRIVFRHEKSGNYSDAVTAVFADGEPRERGYRSCYSHVGQHSSCNRGWYKSNTRPATPEEYAPLLAELRSVGYAVTVTNRVNWSVS